MTDGELYALAAAVAAGEARAFATHPDLVALNAWLDAYYDVSPARVAVSF